MSASFEVRASTGAYTVDIESFAFERFLGVGAKGETRAVADAFFRERLATADLGAIFVEATEANKSLDASPRLIEQLRAGGATRQTHLVAVGGGIVQDLSAFVASVYMRGLAWSYVPTTVLAMVDSCIGGKSSINVGPYKNLVGTIHPPSRVLVDPAVARTLPEDQIASGLIEAVKICFCRGAEAFDRHLAFAPSTRMSTEALEGLIVNSLLAKKHFIEIDEFDRKERLLLNFGHTFGHALEGASRFAISHGIAVGLGILCALAHERAEGTGYDAAPRVARLEAHLEAMIRAVPGLRSAVADVSVDDALERFESDKKHRPDQFSIIVVDAEGAVVMKRVEKSPRTRSAIRAAMASVLETYA